MLHSLGGFLGPKLDFFFDVFKYKNHAPVSPDDWVEAWSTVLASSNDGPTYRIGSPVPGRSILITSAPNVANSLVQ